MRKHTFKTIYWGDDQPMEVVFEAINELPQQELITACVVLALQGALTLFYRNNGTCYRANLKSKRLSP